MTTSVSQTPKTQKSASTCADHPDTHKQATESPGNVPPLATCDSSDDEDEPPRHHEKSPLATSNISVIKSKILSVAVQNALRNSTQARATQWNRQHQLLEKRLSIQLNGKLSPISGDGHSAFRCIAKRLSTEDQHLNIRQQCADYITSNPDLFRQAYHEDIYSENTSTAFETYV